jgi:hypothetical protein
MEISKTCASASEAITRSDFLAFFAQSLQIFEWLTGPFSAICP